MLILKAKNNQHSLTDGQRLLADTYQAKSRASEVCRLILAYEMTAFWRRQQLWQQVKTTARSALVNMPKVTVESDWTERRRAEIGRVKHFLYYRVLIKISALIMFLSIKSSGHSFEEGFGTNSGDEQEHVNSANKLIQGFLLLCLVPAAIVLSIGIVLGWALAPTLIFSTIGFVVALAASVATLFVTFRELALAMKSERQRRNDELRGTEAL